MSRRRATAEVSFWRVYLTAAGLALLPLLIVWQLIDLQLVDSSTGVEFLKRQGDRRAVRIARIPAYRGMITDRRGTPLAVSTPVVSLIADPELLLKSGRLGELAQALGRPLESLESRVSSYAEKQFMYLARFQTPEAARRVLSLKIKGVRGEREYRRFYPAGAVASQLVGLTDDDGVGISGLEAAYEDWLRGTPGRKRYIKDLHGDAIRDIGVIESAEPGSNLALSIDLRIQYLQHRELQRAIAETGALAASAVTLDAWTGEVLAVTNHPTYNPNNRTRFDYASTRNRALTDLYEPGSTVKPLTMVAAIESNAYGLDTVIDTSPGRIRVGGKVFTDQGRHGPMTLSTIIERSSQVGVTKVAQKIGHERLLDVFARFGLGKATGIGFPGERMGSLPSPAHWSEIDKVTLAFGYGLMATPLQIGQAYGVFANQGRRVPLTFLRREEAWWDLGEAVIDAETTAMVLNVLHGVTLRGTGTRARIEGYEVGGKTGTVHKVEQGEYLPDQYLALFAGVAPIERPRYVTVVVLDQPQGDNYGGGSAAAPVYGRITQGVLRLQNVTPNVDAYVSANQDLNHSLAMRSAQ